MRSKLQVALICITSFSSCLSIYLVFKANHAFMSGLNAGLVESSLGQINSSFVSLEMLQTVNDKRVSDSKQMWIGRMNSELATQSFFEDQVTVRPPPWRILIKMNEPTYKTFFKKLQEKRALYHWQSSDPMTEKKIQEVINRYIRYGNLYGL